MKRFTDYKVIFFDCDGVILNSNSIKCDAFDYVARNTGRENRIALLNYNKENGGISRYEKLRWFKHYLDDQGQSFDYSVALAEFSSYVREKLLSVESHLDSLDISVKLNQRWAIVSGGDEEELRDVFKSRGLDKWFDLGIHGSPATKYDIFEKFRNSGLDFSEAVFLGDSVLDYEVAKNFTLDFIFVTDWSDLTNFNDFCSHRQIQIINNLSVLF
jgi:phosphoglycolate phosphatase-like HAD superfamily hydrolase